MIRHAVHIKHLAFKHWPVIVLVFWAATVSLLAYGASVKANNIHYQRYPIIGDTASYWVRDSEFARAAKEGEGSYWERHLRIIKQNPKDPLRTAVFALMPPDAPMQLNGHLAYFSAALFCFILTLCLLILYRTDCLAYALSAPLVLFLATEFFEPIYGFPCKHPDPPSFLLMGSALFTLLLGSGRKSELLWIFAGGIFIGFATLARYHAWIYGLFVLGPIALLFGYRRMRETGRKLFLVTYPAALVLGTALVAGWFIVGMAKTIFTFYSVAAYALDSTVWSTLNTTGKKFIHVYLGVPALMAMGFLFISYIALCFEKGKRLSRFDLAAVLWGAVSFPFLLLIVMRSEDNMEQTVFAIPGLLVLVLVPFVIGLDEARRGIFRRYAMLLLLFLPAMTVFTYYQYINSESFIYPRVAEENEKKFQNALVEYIASEAHDVNGRDLVVDSNFQYYTRYLEPVARMKHNIQIQKDNISRIRETQWSLNGSAVSVILGGMKKNDTFSDAVLARIIADVSHNTYASLTKEVDVYFSLTEPLGNVWQQAFVDAFTRDVVAGINKEIAKNSRVWVLLGKVNGPYGVVSVYKNTSRLAH